MLNWLFIAMTIAAGQDPPAVPALDARAGRAFIEKMVAAWTAANRSIRTLDCRASIETLYPKGALSKERNGRFAPNDPRRIQSLVPAEDVRTTGGTCRWAFDFDGPRIRKEARAKEAYYNLGELPEIKDAHHIKIFASGKFREFRPRGANASPAGPAGAPIPDAMLFEESSKAFLLDFNELPLLWVAGSVTGKLLTPNRMKVLESPGSFSYRGEADYRGHHCHLVTLPDQNSKTAVVEYWVSAEPGFPIHFCRAKDGQIVYWQIDVDYRIEAGEAALSAWTFTQFDYFTQTVYLASTYRVLELQFNRELSADLFDHNPKPGSVVFSVPDNSYKRVLQDGSLAPYVQRTPSRWKWPTIVGAAVVIGLLIFYACAMSAPKHGDGGSYLGVDSLSTLTVGVVMIRDAFGTRRILVTGLLIGAMAFLADLSVAAPPRQNARTGHASWWFQGTCPEKRPEVVG